MTQVENSGESLPSRMDHKQGPLPGHKDKVKDLDHKMEGYENERLKKHTLRKHTGSTGTHAQGNCADCRLS